MKRPILLSVVSISVLTVACATSAPSGPPPDPARFTETEVAIRVAENAEASQRAPELLERSRKAFANARQAATAGNGPVAKAQLDEAKAFAAAAEARARTEKARAEAARLKEEADQLEAKILVLKAQSNQ